MKRNLLKISSFILVIAACLAVISCGEKLSIDDENMNWNLVFITYKSATNVVYCSEEYKETYPEVETLDLSCRAANGKLLIMNDKTQMGYYGTYVSDAESSESSYNVSMTGEDGKVDGYAEVTKVILYDDTVEYNLIIVIDGYTLHFKSLDK